MEKSRPFTAAQPGRLSCALVTMLCVCLAGVTWADDGANGIGDSPGGPSMPIRTPTGTETTIDFETFPDTTPVPGGAEITDQYASVGVTFASADCASGATQVTNVLTIGGPSPPNSLAPCGPAPNNGATLILHFDPPVTMASGFFVDDQFPVEVTAFDAGDAVVDSTSSDGTNVGFDQFVVSHADGIARVELAGGFFGPDSPDGWGVDDLAFEPAAAVPTVFQGGLLVMAVGLSCLLALRVVLRGRTRRRQI